MHLHDLPSGLCHKLVEKSVDRRHGVLRRVERDTLS